MLAATGGGLLPRETFYATGGGLLATGGGLLPRETSFGNW